MYYDFGMQHYNEIECVFVWFRNDFDRIARDGGERERIVRVGLYIVLNLWIIICFKYGFDLPFIILDVGRICIFGNWFSFYKIVLINFKLTKFY